MSDHPAEPLSVGPPVPPTSEAEAAPPADAPKGSRDHLLRDGLILAVVLPIAGVIWAIRLLAKERIGAGLAVLLTAFVVAGAYVAYFTHAGKATPNYSAYSSSIKHEVEARIRQSVKDLSYDSGGSTYSADRVSCVAQSQAIMKCLADVSVGDGSAADFMGDAPPPDTYTATYEVTIDQSDGSYLIGAPDVQDTSSP